MVSDNVNHPKHYNSHPSGVECITITEHMNFNIGNAIKYLWRSGLKEWGKIDQPSAIEAAKLAHKKHIEDLQKARWHIEREIQRLNHITIAVDMGAGDRTVVVKMRARGDGTYEVMEEFSLKPAEGGQ